MKTRNTFNALLALLLSTALLSAVLSAAESETEMPAWKTEFERICSQTKEAISLEPEQLRELISDSDRLLKELKELEDPSAKIYVFRLEKCKVFFEYAYDLKEDW